MMRSWWTIRCTPSNLEHFWGHTAGATMVLNIASHKQHTSHLVFGCILAVWGTFTHMQPLILDLICSFLCSGVCVCSWCIASIPLYSDLIAVDHIINAVKGWCVIFWCNNVPGDNLHYQLWLSGSNSLSTVTIHTHRNQSWTQLIQEILEQTQCCYQ